MNFSRVLIKFVFERPPLKITLQIFVQMQYVDTEEGARYLRRFVPI